MSIFMLIMPPQRDRVEHMLPRNVLVLCVLLVAPVQAAPPLDFVLTHEDGEASRDSSSTKITLTVKGDKVHYSYRYSGRDSGPPWQGPKEADGVIRDVKKVEALIAAIDEIPPPKKKEGSLTDVRYERACLIRGKQERCALRIDKEPPGPELTALNALYAALRRSIHPGE